MNLKERLKQNSKMKTIVFVSSFCKYISPFITTIFLKTNLTPNDITLMMIGSGIIGATLFSIPNTIIKIIGIVFIYLWFILDLCDGEVARIKKIFSKFGQEMDYCAHVINHPLFNLSFAITIFQITGEYRYMFLFLVLISFNMAYRFFQAVNRIYIIRMLDGTNPKTSNVIEARRKDKIIYFVNIFVHYPNFALFFPVICLINYNVAIVYMCIVILFNIIYIPYIYIHFLRNIRKIY